ncbi:MAG: penicillin-binding protein activator [Hyphomicrobiales bacterium]|nr:penicillin-binding protein activator [Hyphomicrobiales bacterium]
MGMTVNTGTGWRGVLPLLGALLTAGVVAGCAQQGQLSPPATAALPARDAGSASASASEATPRAPERRATTKVALLLPLSGPGQSALVAEAMKRAAELSIADANASHIQLMVRDDKGTPEGAQAAASEVLQAGAEIVLGPLFARSVSTVSAPARAANVPVVAFSNDRQVAGGGVHLLSFLAAPEVHRVIGYATQKGRKRFAALIPDDAYGRIVETAFREAVQRAGAQAVAVETYQPEANRKLDAVKRLRDGVRGLEEHGDPVDAIFLPGGEDAVTTLMPQLRQAGFDFTRMKIVGTGGLDYANAGRDPQLVGAWYAAPDPQGWKDFSERYGKTFGIAPPRVASLAYDAVTVVAALSSGPPGARYIPSQLTRSSGFVGVDGQFRLSADGTVERALAVLEVQAFGASVIDPAQPLAGAAPLNAALPNAAAGPRGSALN